MKKLKPLLEKLYKKYNHKNYIDPDPLIFLYNYEDPKNQEIVGLIASSLAYGRVAQILKSVEKVLTPMGAEPREFIENTNEFELQKLFCGFKHRFTDEHDLIFLLLSIKRILKQYGSLESCFLENYHTANETIIHAQESFVDILTDNHCNYLLPHPSNKSACKRLNMFFRWMVRKDDVDPGCWKHVNPAALIIPLDAHMHVAGKLLGFTKRKAADLKTALEITEAFRKINSSDPVKYDFALTRLGIRQDISFDELEKAIKT